MSAAPSDAIALDRASARTYDADGHLHVSATNISKSNICPYVGSEIPNWEELGLDPQRIYQMYRDPVELEKGAESFDGKPLLFTHKPTTASDHQTELVVGAVMNPVWVPPYLKAELVVWPGEAISAIQDGSQRELSCGYRYTAVMEPGSIHNEYFDGRMTGIIANHVAIVEAGRAGPDCYVGDSKPKEMFNMTKVALTKSAAVAQGALVAYLQPLLAADAKIDLSPVVGKITAKNFKSMKAAIAADVAKITKGTLRPDANLDDLPALLGAMDAMCAKDEDDDLAEDEDDEEEDDKKKKDKKTPVAAEDEEEDDEGGKGSPPPFKGKPKVGGASDEDKDMVTKAAMDAAMKRASAEAETATMRRLTDIRAAERAVAPLIGEVTIGLDSAEAIYSAALKAKGISVAGVHPSAFPAMVDMLNKHAATPARSARVAQDAAPASARAEFEKLHGIPARRIRNLG